MRFQNKMISWTVVCVLVFEIVQYLDVGSCNPIMHQHKLHFVKSSHTNHVPQQHIDKVLSMTSSSSPKSQHQNIGGVLECKACDLAISYALWKFKTPDKKYEGLFPFAINVCTMLKIEQPAVCSGMVNAMKNETQYLLSSIDVTGKMVCALIFPSMCSTSALSWDKDKWVVKIPPAIKPQISDKKHTLNLSTRKLRVLHITDVHIDLLYKPGSQVNCNAPLCCHHPAKAGDEVAGFWGTAAYCDTPYWTVENFLSQVSKQKFDYIIWTGDLPAHNDWSQSRESQLFLLSNLTNLLIKYFPNTPIYPALGNHESFPVNSFPPNYVHGYDSTKWLYNALSKAWSPWLPKDALDTVRASGFYTTLVSKGVRIVSLNMNYCNDENFWMLKNPVDPNGELEWLVQILFQAEKNNETVHIIGHIPPAGGKASDCLQVWRNNYYAIVNRFQHTIKAQFFGHTHTDEIAILYNDSSLAHPVSVFYIAPSITTFHNLNPGYRIYDMDADSGSVLDHHTYILNLTKANQPGQNPIWEFEYSAKQAYNLSSLSPDSWHRLYMSWINHADPQNTLQSYYRYFYKGRVPNAVCNESCQKNLFCNIASGNFTNPFCM